MKSKRDEKNRPDNKRIDSGAVEVDSDNRNNENGSLKTWRGADEGREGRRGGRC